MRHYRIMYATSFDDLERLVCDKLIDGYKPVGGVSYVANRWYCQSIFKEFEE